MCQHRGPDRGWHGIERTRVVLQIAEVLAIDACSRRSHAIRSVEMVAVAWGQRLPKLNEALGVNVLFEENLARRNTGSVEDRVEVFLYGNIRLGAYPYERVLCDTSAVQTLSADRITLFERTCDHEHNAMRLRQWRADLLTRREPRRALLEKHVLDLYYTKFTNLITDNDKTILTKFDSTTA